MPIRFNVAGGAGHNPITRSMIIFYYNQTISAELISFFSNLDSAVAADGGKDNRIDSCFQKNKIIKSSSPLSKAKYAVKTTRLRSWIYRRPRPIAFGEDYRSAQCPARTHRRYMLIARKSFKPVWRRRRRRRSPRINNNNKNNINSYYFVLETSVVAQ